MNIFLHVTDEASSTVWLQQNSVLKYEYFELDVISFHDITRVT